MNDARQDPLPSLPHAVTGPPLASPIDLVSSLPSAGSVTVISRVTTVTRDDLSQRWTPVGEAGALIMGVATAGLQSVVVRMPGEHPVDGLVAEGELQVRFAGADGVQAALAIPVVPGERTPALDALLGGVLDVHGLVPPGREVLAYQGSETIPPFQQPTMWLVSRTPMTADEAQLAVLGREPPLPPRRVQPSEDRAVERLAVKLITLRDEADDHELATSFS